MERTEHKNIINQLMTMVSSEHQADASMLLTQLSDDYEQTLTLSETANASVQELTERNEKLRAVNADLFLKVGTTTQSVTNNNETGGQSEDAPQQEKMTFESLFNEKGELI